MAIYHCSLVDKSAGVDEHRRHADDAGRNVRAVTYARPTGNDAHAIVRRKSSDWISVLVEKLKTGVSGRHFHNRAHAKAEQDAALHPGIRLPLAVRGPLSRTHLAAVERLFEIIEEREVVGRILLGHPCGERFNLVR